LIKCLQPIALPRVFPPIRELIHRGLGELQRRNNANLSLMSSFLLFEVRSDVLFMFTSVRLNLEMVVRTHFFS
jgi:hypothetical protein